MSAATRRHRGQQLEAEDAAELNLGDDFNNQNDVTTLSQGEAAAILEKILMPEDPTARAEREALPENP